MFLYGMIYSLKLHHCSVIALGLSLIILSCPLKTQLLSLSEVVYQSSGILTSNFEESSKRVRVPNGIYHNGGQWQGGGPPVAGQSANYLQW